MGTSDRNVDIRAKVERVLDRTTIISDWVEYEILNAKNAVTGCLYIEKFIRLAQVSKKHHLHSMHQLTRNLHRCCFLMAIFRL